MNPGAQSFHIKERHEPLASYRGEIVTNVNCRDHHIQNNPNSWKMVLIWMLSADSVLLKNLCFTGFIADANFIDVTESKLNSFLPLRRLDLRSVP